MEISKVRCQMCDSVGQWKNVDQYRYKASGMCICTSCGFVTYPEIIGKTEDLTEFYKNEYRDAPTYQNIQTGERKLHYHAFFLDSQFKAWADAGLKKPKIFESGAAFGMFLDWIKRVFPEATTHGTELTQSYVRNAKYLYNIDLTDKIDETQTYDMIASYKVAEHIPNFDVELGKYFKCLNDDGVLYISVPTWFGRLNNFGATGYSLEYYYSTNHVNCWTRAAFENLLARNGFEIIKQDHAIYDDTYLCKKNSLLTGTLVHKEDPIKIEDCLKRIYEASVAYDEGQFDKAIAAWPDFPEAHRGKYEGARAQNHKQGFEWIHENIVKKALDACPGSATILADLGADVCMRYSQWKQALKYLQGALDVRPNDPGILLNMSHCYRNMAQEEKDLTESLRLLAESRKICLYTQTVSMQAKPEALTWAMLDNSKIPTPAEMAGLTKKVPESPTPIEKSGA